MGREREPNMADNVAETLDKMNLGDSKDGKALKQKKAKAKKEKDGGGGPKAKVLDPPPGVIAERLAMFDRLKAEQDAMIAAKESVDITVTLPDGKTVAGKSWRTTPYEVACGISKGLADNSVVAKVNGEMWDLDRVLEGDAKLELIKFSDDEGQYVFWHSSAHILGQAMEKIYGGQLCYGPPIETGFYYDMSADQAVKEEDYKCIDDLVGKIVKEKQPFDRIEMKKSDLLEMFKYNEFKLRILNEKVKTPTTTVYRNGPLIDLCRGPHVRHTGKVKAFSVTKNSATYWEGNAEAESLQRIYGISFPESKQMKEWKHFQEEAAKRDHRKIGVQQDLFFFHELSPGSCFFQPKGAHIYNAKLWQTSGHWDHYSENMFKISIEKEAFGLKPMNCPGHCVMFDQTTRSWKELPLRMADFGVLHRNELSGALTGLTRVRRFQQDDAHIFCMPDQIQEEIAGALDFLNTVYSTFGFTYSLELSTRPEGFLGEIETWNKAERMMEDSLNQSGLKWSLNPADGAFYGPKIDITLKDALNRQHQCATIQLDFQLPIRFNLSYVDDKGEKAKPVIIHRAVLGSVERMFAVLLESCAGKWPFWISPRQVMVVPVAGPFNEYANKIRQELRSSGYMCDSDTDDSNTMNKKVRNAQLAQYNFIFVVGEKERENGTVNIRTRDNKVHGEKSIAQVKELFKELSEKRILNSEEYSVQDVTDQLSGME